VPDVRFMIHHAAVQHPYRGDSFELATRLAPLILKFSERENISITYTQCVTFRGLVQRIATGAV